MSRGSVFIPDCPKCGESNMELVYNGCSMTSSSPAEYPEFRCNSCYWEGPLPLDCDGVWYDMIIE